MKLTLCITGILLGLVLWSEAADRKFPGKEDNCLCDKDCGKSDFVCVINYNGKGRCRQIFNKCIGTSTTEAPTTVASTTEAPTTVATTKVAPTTAATTKAAPTIAFLGACANGKHKIIDDWNRNVNLTNNGAPNSTCDVSLPLDFYRFLLNGKSAVLPTTCPEMSHCGTDAPMWLDLGGHSLPAPDQQLTGVRTCVVWGDICCEWTVPDVTVVNCGDFYIYRLKGSRVCKARYCAMLA